MYIDILGFNAIPQDMEMQAGINEEVARENYLRNPILKK